MFRVRGFTVLEALVSLVMLSLITVLLVQALIQIGVIRERVLRHERDQRVAQLKEAWFRDSVAGLLVLPNDAVSLEGDSSGFKGVSSAPLRRASGVVEVQWKVVASANAAGLGYVEMQSDVVLIERSLDVLVFDYLDREGNWRAKWPQEGQPPSDLPGAIRATFSRGGETWAWIVPVSAQRPPGAPALPEMGI